MAISKKKWIIVAAAAGVLGIGAAVFCSQMSTRIEAEIRQRIASLPGVSQSSIGSVQYDFWTRTATLNELRISAQAAGQPTQFHAEQVVIVKPNIDALQGKASTSTLLAEELRFKQYTVATPETKVTSASVRLVGLHGDAPNLLSLMQNDMQPQDLPECYRKLASFKLEAFDYQDMRMVITLPELPAMHMSLAALDGKNITIASIGSYAVKDMKVTLGPLGAFSIGGLEIKALALPDLSKLSPQLLHGNEEDAQALAQALISLLPKDKPMLGALTITNVRESISQQKWEAKLLSLKDFGYAPAQMTLTVQGLLLPGQWDDYVDMVLPQDERILVSSETVIRPSGDKAWNVVFDLELDQMAAVHSTADVFSTTSAAFDALATPRNLWVKDFSLTFKDKGIAAPLVALAGLAVEMNPDKLLLLAKGLVTDALGNKPENVAQVMAFVQKPGELTVDYKPEKPLPALDMPSLLQNTKELRFSSKPGAKSLRELMPQ